MSNDGSVTANDLFAANSESGEAGTQQQGNTFIPNNRPKGPINWWDPTTNPNGPVEGGPMGYALPGYDVRPQGNLIDPYAGLYGGAPEQATNEENRYNQMARAARNAQGPRIDYSGTNGALRLADLDAQRQDAAQRNFMDVVQGRAPSVALAQQNEALANANAQAHAAMAHTRGGGAGLMGAQRAAANSYAGAGTQAIGQGAMGRLAEQSGALGGFAQSATTQRQGSLAENKMSNDNAYQQALLQERQNALNADTGLSYEQMRQNVFRDQQAGTEWNEAQNYQAYMQGAGLGVTAGEYNTAEGNKYAGMGTSAAGNALTNIENASSSGSGSGSTTSDIRAKKDIKPGAAQTEAQLDSIHGLAMPNGGQHLEVDTSRRPAMQGYGHGRADLALRGKPSLAELRAGVYGMAPDTSSAERRAAEHLYDARQAQFAQAAAQMAARPTPHAAVGPTATADEIAAGVLGSRMVPSYGPTPTGQEIAGQILGPGERPPVATVLGGAPVVPSDEGLKTNIRNAPVEEALDHLKPYSYRYKDPSLGEGQRTGIMAQDLEKSPVGLSTVIQTPKGKGIDVNRGLSLSLASVADLHARVKALEAKRGQ